MSEKKKERCLLFFGVVATYFLCLCGQSKADQIFFSEREGSSAFQGELLTLREGVVKWGRPELTPQPFLFTAEKVEKIVCDGGFAATESSYEALLYLVNGDQLRGNILKLDKEILYFKTHYSTVLHIKRSSVDRIGMQDILRDPLYAGAKAAEEWEYVRLMKREKNEKIGFVHGDFIFYGEGSLSKEVLPREESVIEFRFLTKNPRFKVELGEQPHKYDVNFFHDSVSVELKYGQGVQTIKKLVNISQRENSLQKGRENQVRIYFHRENKRVGVSLNGERIVWYQDTSGPGQFPPVQGKKIKITHRGKGEFFLKKMKIYPWDGGQVRGGGERLQVGEKDEVSLIGKEKLAGTLSTITREQLVVHSEKKHLVDKKQVDEIYFGRQSQREAPEQKKFALLTFQGGDRFTADLRAIDEKHVSMTSPWLANSVSLQRAWLQEISFPAKKQISSSDTVYLASGEKLSGELERVAQNTCHWRGGALQKSVQFRLGDLNRIQLGSSIWEKKPTKGTRCFFELINQDRVPGRLKEIGEKEIEMWTLEGEESAIRVDLVESIWFLERDQHLSVYEGPRGESEWFQLIASPKKQSREYAYTHVVPIQDAEELPAFAGWIYEDNAFYSGRGGVLGKEMKDLPEKFFFEFDLDWKEALDFSLIVLSDHKDIVSAENYYALNFARSFDPKRGVEEGTYINFYRCDSAPKTRSMLTSRWRGWLDPRKFVEPKYVQVPELFVAQDEEGATVEVRLLVDKKKGSFSLLLNDRLIQIWEDLQGSKEGNFFFLQKGVANPQGRMRIRNLKVGYWSEKMNPQEKIKEDKVIFKNYDHVYGKVKGVQGSNLILRTTGIDITIPMERLLQVQLQGEKIWQMEPESGKVSVHYHGGGWESLALKKIAGDRIVGVSSLLGAKEWRREDIKEIHFNVTDKRGGGETIPSWKVSDERLQNK